MGVKVSYGLFSISEKVFATCLLEELCLQHIRCFLAKNVEQSPPATVHGCV